MVNGTVQLCQCVCEGMRALGVLFSVIDRTMPTVTVRTSIERLVIWGNAVFDGGGVDADLRRDGTDQPCVHSTFYMIGAFATAVAVLDGVVFLRGAVKFHCRGQG